MTAVDTPKTISPTDLAAMAARSVGENSAPVSAPAHRRRSRWPWLAAAVGVALAVAAAGTAASRALADEPVTSPLGPGDVTIELGVEHSLFVQDELRVVEGTRVRFVVVNGDPINHELIVGPPDVHARHATGTEAEHPSIPGEVSVGPNGTAITTFRFDDPGTFEFACHLPGHYEYGMHGIVEVVPAAG
jgi:uncharacterized cupredoxin-like copper-binding protein